MRQLTFKGFLKKYVHELSYNGSYSIAFLANEAQGNYRLREPLLFYAVLTNQEDILLKSSPIGLRSSYEEVLPLIYSKQTSKLPDAYKKVIDAYKVKATRLQTDQQMVSNARQTVLKLQQQKNITTYRICTDLNLNKGNVNSWLLHGSTGKVGYDNAVKIVKYLKAK